MPTLPPVVKMLPIVLLFPSALSDDVTRIDPAETFVSSKFVVVTLTVVSVPATTKLPDKLMFPPVNVVADNNVEVTVENEPRVENNTPAVTPVVATRVPAVTLVTTTLPIVAEDVDTLLVVIRVEANNVGTVKVLVTCKLFVVMFDTKTFVEV